MKFLKYIKIFCKWQGGVFSKHYKLNEVVSQEVIKSSVTHKTKCVYTFAEKKSDKLQQCKRSYIVYATDGSVFDLLFFFLSFIQLMFDNVSLKIYS